MRVDVLVESKLCPFQHGRAAGRLILIPFRFREMVLVEQFRHLGIKRRRRDVLSQNAQAGALPGFQLVQSAAEGRQCLVPGPRPAAIRQGLRTVRIVQAEDGRLNEQIGGAEAGRMTGIALDLRRTALVALDENAGGQPRQRHGRGEVQRLARHHRFRLPNVGHDLLARSRLCRAAVQPRQGQRRAHQQEEAPPRDRIGPLRRLIGEFAVDHLLELGRVQELLQAAPVSAGRSARRGAEATLPNQQAWSCSSNGCGPLAP